MLFKLINAFIIFETYINNILKEHLDIFMIICFNDILIYLKNEKNHKKYIRQVLSTLRKANLKTVSEKSQFY